MYYFFGNQKLSIGGAAEKIVSAFHLVLSEHPSEDAEMSKCKSAVHRVRKMEKDVDFTCANGKPSTMCIEVVAYMEFPLTGLLLHVSSNRHPKGIYSLLSLFLSEGSKAKNSVQRTGGGGKYIETVY
jgi:hypothetical protein